MKKFFIIILVSVLPVYGMALDECGIYELEGVLRKKEGKNFFIYHEQATSEIRFEITKSLSPLSRIKDGTPIRSNFLLINKCDYDCQIELRAALTIDPTRREKRELEFLAPKKEMSCDEAVKK